MTQQADNCIDWNKDKLRDFKSAYKEAVKISHDTVNDVFMFEDNIFVISYAKYLIEYLEQRLQ